MIQCMAIESSQPPGTGIDNKAVNKVRTRAAKWILLIGAIPIVIFLGPTIIVFLGYQCAAVRFNQEYPFNTARIIDANTLEVYPSLIQPICIVLASTKVSINSPKDLYPTSVQLTPEKLRVGSFNLTPELWWCEPDAGLEMPENSLEAVWLPLGGAEIGMRTQYKVTSKVAGLQQLLNDKEIIIVMISETDNGTKALLIPENSIR